MNCGNCGVEMEAKRENYRFVESGLENVTLQNVEVRACERCGAREVVIPRMAELHRLLGKLVAEKPLRLSGPEFRFLRKHMGYASVDLARVLGVAPETISRWENGKLSISQAAEIAVREMVRSGRRADEYQPPSGEAESTPLFVALDKTWQPGKAA